MPAIVTHNQPEKILNDTSISNLLPTTKLREILHSQLFWRQLLTIDTHLLNHVPWLTRQRRLVGWCGLGCYADTQPRPAVARKTIKARRRRRKQWRHFFTLPSRDFGAAVDCGAGGVIDYLNLNYDTSPHSRHCRHSFLVLILDVTHAAQQHIIRLEKLNLCMLCQQQQSWATLPV